MPRKLKQSTHLKTHVILFKLNVELLNAFSAIISFTWNRSASFLKRFKSNLAPVPNLRKKSMEAAMFVVFKSVLPECYSQKRPNIRMWHLVAFASDEINLAQLGALRKISLSYQNLF